MDNGGEPHEIACRATLGLYSLATAVAIMTTQTTDAGPKNARTVAKSGQ